MKLRWKIGLGVASCAAVGWGFALFFVHQNGQILSVNSQGGSIALQHDAAPPSPAPKTQNNNNLIVRTPLSEANTLPVNGAQGMPTSQTPAGSANGGSTDGGNGASSGSNSASQLPGPEQFTIYNEYANKSEAYFGEIYAGTGPDVKVGSQVTVNYRGWLTNGALFDESYARGQPFTFEEGAHTVILGWEQGLFGMKVGGKRRLIIPPKVGYGDQAKGSIPANSVLVFDVELLGVK